MSPRPRGRPKKKVAAKVEPVRPSLEVEIVMEDDLTFTAPHGMYVVKYQCPNKFDCGASFEVHSLGVLAMRCASCGTRMQVTTRKVEQ